MKNITHINKEVAETKNMPLETVTKINDYYWSAVKDAMRSIDHQFIHIKQLGTFEVSRFKINRQIQNLREYIKNIRQSNKYTDARKEHIINDYKLKYVKYLAMRKEVNQTLEFLNTYKDDDSE